jgi:hypothetical protein
MRLDRLTLWSLVPAFAGLALAAYAAVGAALLIGPPSLDVGRLQGLTLSATVGVAAARLSATLAP